MGQQQQWVVLDTETTGLSERSRLVEFACERLAEDGRCLESYASLVAAGRRPGPTRVHGIIESDLRGAPTFREIAADIARLLRGAIPVAHNLRFDWSVLRAEFARVQVVLPILPRGVCTATLTRTFSGGRSRLGDACRQLGIDRSRPHEAAADVVATRRVFLELRARGATLPPVAACEPFHGAWRLPAPAPPVPRQ